MKNLVKKFQLMSNQAEDNTEGSPSSRGITKSNETPFSDRFVPPSSRSRQNPEHKPFSGLSNWLTSVAHRKIPNPPSSSDSVSNSGLGVVPEAVTQDLESRNSRDPDIEEEFQIQMALELSAREDPEAVQIEAVKQISLGSCDPENTPAEVITYRYWNYNALNYDDKILDGFCDLYGVLTDSTSERMPSLTDLQGTPVFGNVTWEAVLVNRAADANLLKLEQKASEMAVNSRLESLVSVSSDLLRKLAVLVSDYMGGPVGDPSEMSRAWQSLSYSLKATLGSMVLPLGSLTIGLSCHRALLFKVLADSVGVPCRLVKGQQFLGSDNVAMNFVRVDDGREYIVDLMADPGTLIPSDVAGSVIEFDDLFFSTSPLSRDIDSSHVASSSGGVGSSFEEHSELGTLEEKFRSKNSFAAEGQSEETIEFHNFANLTKPNKADEGSKTQSDLKHFATAEKFLVREPPSRSNYPYMHVRSPSWTEGVSLPDALEKKAKYVSQCMIDAAKENPQFAQKLHDVLVESGIVAPPNLFSEIYPEKLDASTSEGKISSQVTYSPRERMGNQDTKDQTKCSPPRLLPPLPHRVGSNTSPSYNQDERYKSVEGMGVNLHLDIREGTQKPIVSQLSENNLKNVPVAAAAAAAVVASSMVIAVAKTSTDSNLPIAAATATAAAVVATTAAVNQQYKQGIRCDGDDDGTGNEPHGSGDQECDPLAENSEGERVSDRSVGNDSSKSDVTLDDVAECEILWEDITLGERIGLGSYGEVYHGDWHGTEVAVKRFLDQDLYGQALEEFRSEVHIMKRVRHPNVVLFMGAVTRAPNLSIVTEFLPRGSLYRLLHRPNNQLDERRRLRMALDAARGMNYLHSCTPVIVHRDLKSPNLLVDKNWIVKVCDFGLSRTKHSTFLSSRSTAGTAEWMAPEVLRNEPSDEKCDVYSFGVILWELCTLQQPWGGMNPMQVVGAVGFQHRRLDIPEHMDPAIADIIRQCWQTDPKLRPTFAEIMAALKPLQKPITSSQLHRTSTSARGHDKGQQSQVAEDLAS